MNLPKENILIEIILIIIILPKDDELCLRRIKLREILMEARSGTNI